MVSQGFTHAAEPHIPSWLVHATVWWLQEDISDGAYVAMLEYLLEYGIASA